MTLGRSSLGLLRELVPDAKRIGLLVNPHNANVEDIKKEVSYLHAVKLEILLDPRVADGLRRAAEERNTTMEAMASLAIHSWLRQQRYA